MQTFLLAALTALLSLQAFAQGQVVFANGVTGLLNAPVTLAGGAGPGPSWTAQLHLFGAGGALTPLTPTSTFLPAGTGVGAIASQYWEPKVVDVPGVASGQIATFVVRAWASEFESYEHAVGSGLGGESAPFTVIVGGGLLPPANLTTLQPFSITLVPEPSRIAIAAMGLTAFLGFRLRR
jgi:hypothetical protein